MRGLSQKVSSLKAISLNINQTYTLTLNFKINFTLLWQNFLYKKKKKKKLTKNNNKNWLNNANKSLDDICLNQNACAMNK